MQRIFIDNHDRILYYSNPAGYIAGKEAVVDAMFQTQELERFLQKQSLTIRWEDGVYDRLLLGQRGGRFDPEAPPLKSCRVWQLTRDSPINMRFIPYEALLEAFPDSPTVSTTKRSMTVWSGPMTRRRSTRSSATRFPATTADPSASRMCWSCTTPTAAEFYYCDRVGFRQIEFAPRQEMDLCP
ncbi:MAG: YodL domain-containing protein [Oscillospiraceae bacterium]